MSIGSSVGTIPLVVANGGTGAATLTGLLVGNGTSAFTVDGYTAAASYTPALGTSSGSFTTLTYTTQFGRYCRLGPVVYFVANVVANSVNATGATGNLTISLPVAAGAFSPAGICAAQYQGMNLTITGIATFTASIATGASVATFIETINNNTQTVVAATSLASSATVTVCGFYFAA